MNTKFIKYASFAEVLQPLLVGGCWSGSGIVSDHPRWMRGWMGDDFDVVRKDLPSQGTTEDRQTPRRTDRHTHRRTDRPQTDTLFLTE